MAIQPILQDGADTEGVQILREIAKPVPPELFGSKELATMLKDMTDTLDKEPDGVALAAPQIGLSYRIFVVRHDRTVPPEKDIGENDEEENSGTSETNTTPVIGVFINPQFVKSSRRRTEMWEGCLSVRGWYGYALRNERATIRAQDEQGKFFERGGGGLLAEIFQHEIDHLNGILFTDHAEGLVVVKNENEETAPPNA